MVIGKKTVGSIIAVVVAAAIIFSVWTFVINVGGAENPSQAIGYFMVAVKERDYDEARKYLTKEASSMYDRYKLDRFNQVFKSTAAINSTSSIEIRGDFASGVIMEGKNVLYNVNLERKWGKWRISTIR